MNLELEAARVRHIKTAHYNQLLTGEITIYLDEVWEKFEHTIRKISEPYVRR